MARARWPGWTPQHTLLLTVPRDAWPPPEAPVTLQGITLHPKRELHVTLVGNHLGRELDAAAAAGRIDADAIRRAFEARDWRWTRTGRLSLLEAPPSRRGGPARHALIEHIVLPAMAPFHAALGGLVGRPLPVPPPHVTLYVSGTRRGIGVPDPATLAKFRRKGPFTPATQGRGDAGGPP